MIFRRKKPQGGGANLPPMDKLDRPLALAMRHKRAIVQPTAAEAPDGSRESGVKIGPSLLRDEPPRRAAIVPSMTERAEKSSQSESRKLIVGREITLNGRIGACDWLVVEGRVEADLANCRTVEVREGGSFKGTAMVETAEISGRFEGALTVRGALAIHRTGQIEGTVRYGRLEIHAGGEIGGDVKSLAGEGLATPDRDARGFADKDGGVPAFRSAGED